MESPSVPIDVVYSDVKMPSFSRWVMLRNKAYEEYRKKWSKNPGRFLVERFPLHLDVESTNQCNLRCPMCQSVRAMDAGSPAFNTMGFMEWDLFRKVIDDISDENGGLVPAIKLSCRGEPLLHKEIVRMIQYAKQRGILEVALNTNGVLLTPELSEQILDAGLDCLLLSFDAATRETYEKIRVGADYDEVLANIREFARIREKKSAYQTMIRAGMVVTDVNRHETKAFTELFCNFADVVNFNKESRDLVPVDDDHVYDERTGVTRNVKEHDFACSMPWQRMRIYWDGTIGLCCNDYWGAASQFTVKENSVEELWHRPQLHHYREAHQSGKWWSVKPCRTCPFPFHQLF